MGKIFTLDGINSGLLLGTCNDDIVQGSQSKPYVRNGRKGIIRLLQGDDTIRSMSEIRLYGETSMGRGRDVVTGLESISLLAVDYKNGNLNMGRGSDKVEVIEGPLRVGEDSSLDTYSGNDLISANELTVLGGNVNTGAGIDRIDLGDGRASVILGTIWMGDGDDQLVARGGLRLSDGSLHMGAGNDMVDVGNSGIDMWDSQWDNLRLGSGNDRLVGFAAIPSDERPPQSSGGMARGGRGKDSIVLSEGFYTVTTDRISNAETFINVAGFNILEGVNGGRFDFAPGILNVNNQGVASFTAAM